MIRLPLLDYSSKSRNSYAVTTSSLDCFRSIGICLFLQPNFSLTSELTQKSQTGLLCKCPSVFEQDKGVIKFQTARLFSGQSSAITPNANNERVTRLWALAVAQVSLRWARDRTVLGNSRQNSCFVVLTRILVKVAHK